MEPPSATSWKYDPLQYIPGHPAFNDIVRVALAFTNCANLIFHDNIYKVRLSQINLDIQYWCIYLYNSIYVYHCISLIKSYHRWDTVGHIRHAPKPLGAVASHPGSNPWGRTRMRHLGNQTAHWQQRRRKSTFQLFHMFHLFHIFIDHISSIHFKYS